MPSCKVDQPDLHLITIALQNSEYKVALSCIDECDDVIVENIHVEQGRKNINDFGYFFAITDEASTGVNLA